MSPATWSRLALLTLHAGGWQGEITTSSLPPNPGCEYTLRQLSSLPMAVKGTRRVSAMPNRRKSVYRPNGSCLSNTLIAQNRSRGSALSRQLLSSATLHSNGLMAAAAWRSGYQPVRATALLETASLREPASAMLEAQQLTR